MSNLGITGTRKGMNGYQSEIVELVVGQYTRFHHGDCIGVDVEAAHIAHDAGLKICCHPPDSDDQRGFFYHHDKIMRPKPFLVRNHDIVDHSDLLLAIPGENRERLRSGTWATVRYARKQQKPIIIVYPYRFEGELGAELYRVV